MFKKVILIMDFEKFRDFLIILSSISVHNFYQNKLRPQLIWLL